MLQVAAVQFCPSPNGRVNNLAVSLPDKYLAGTLIIECNLNKIHNQQTVPEKEQSLTVSDSITDTK